MFSVKNEKRELNRTEVAPVEMERSHSLVKNIYKVLVSQTQKPVQQSVKSQQFVCSLRRIQLMTGTGAHRQERPLTAWLLTGHRAPFPSQGTSAQQPASSLGNTQHVQLGTILHCREDFAGAT